eukprot:4597546-Amphidinium_carterae.1
MGRSYSESSTLHMSDRPFSDAICASSMSDNRPLRLPEQPDLKRSVSPCAPLGSHTIAEQLLPQTS